MTNSEWKRKANAIIEEVLEKTVEEYLQSRIDEPIEKAAASFDFDQDSPITHQTFIQVITDFVRNVYKQGLNLGQEMSEREASAEAVAILEEGYQAAYSRGYYAAFLDALNPNLNGLEYVLVQMAGCIIAMARAKYIRMVCASRMELADWPTRCLIAETLLNRWGSSLPQNLRGCSPAQLAHHLSQLINLELLSNRPVNKMMCGNIDVFNF